MKNLIVGIILTSFAACGIEEKQSEQLDSVKKDSVVIKPIDSLSTDSVKTAKDTL